MGRWKSLREPAWAEELRLAGPWAPKKPVSHPRGQMSLELRTGWLECTTEVIGVNVVFKCMRRVQITREGSVTGRRENSKSEAWDLQCVEVGKMRKDQPWDQEGWPRMGREEPAALSLAERVGVVPGILRLLMGQVGGGPSHPTERHRSL